MIGVMHRWPVLRRAVLGQSEIIGDRDRLVMGNQEAVEWALKRCPAPHARRGTAAVQIYRGATAERVVLSVCRQSFLVRAPAQFGGLVAFANEAVDRPG